MAPAHELDAAAGRTDRAKSENAVRWAATPRMDRVRGPPADAGDNSVKRVRTADV